MNRSRLLVAMLVAGAIFSSWRPASAAAPTRLSAASWLLNAWVNDDRGLAGFNGGTFLSKPYATLTDSSGAPIANRRIDFKRQTTLLCSAVTDLKGHATCAADAIPGYSAYFAGDEQFAASSAEGAGVRLTVGKCDSTVLSDSSTWDIAVC